jgi:hypothetical protein
VGVTERDCEEDPEDSEDEEFESVSVSVSDSDNDDSSDSVADDEVVEDTEEDVDVVYRELFSDGRLCISIGWRMNIEI